MSTVQKSDQIIIIDDDANTRVGQSKNTNFETSNETNLRRNLENVKMEDLSRLAHTFTVMLGALYGISSEDVNRMMESKKGLMTELYNVIETLSKVFRDSSSKKVPKALQRGVNSSCNLEIPPNVSLDISTNGANNFFSVPINESKGETSTNRDTLVSPRVTLINKEEPPVNFQQNDNATIPMNIQRDINPIRPSINEKEKSTTSGIKIGDNWELPIIVLDSDDDENETEVIEVDSDEEEIKRMMSLDDFDCIEIGKDEFNKSKKGDNEVTDDDTEEELFIPVVPGEGSAPKKRRHTYKLRPRPPTKVQRTISCLDLDSEINDDPSRWRKDLHPFPFISNHLLRVWATGYLHYRDEWERLEYLGDKVLMFCVLRFATAKYLRFHTPSDIKIATTFLVSNKLLAAYSLTLGLDKQNQMQGLNKRVADAFEAYIGAYYLSDGEEATTRYLEQLMSPLFELVLSNLQTGREQVMGVIAKYFQMTFLTRIPKLK